ncbi:hypothetical protein BGX38DRAFT_1143076 [Terfezia claveryi]|nr:hypothetical protein BGX38DRAFT_1143076 [Terfezia claveryi]
MRLYFTQEFVWITRNHFDWQRVDQPPAQSPKLLQELVSNEHNRHPGTKITSIERAWRPLQYTPDLHPATTSITSSTVVEAQESRDILQFFATSSYQKPATSTLHSSPNEHSWPIRPKITPTPQSQPIGHRSHFTDRQPQPVDIPSRKNNPGKMDRVNPPLKTRLPVTGHPQPPSLLQPPLKQQQRGTDNASHLMMTDHDDYECDIESDRNYNDDETSMKDHFRGVWDIVITEALQGISKCSSRSLSEVLIPGILQKHSPEPQAPPPLRHPHTQRQRQEIAGFNV